MRSPPARASQQAASAAFALLAEPFRATAHRRAEALGYGMRSPPARASQQAASVAFALLAEPFRATAHRRAEALGYGMRSPPARASQQAASVAFALLAEPFRATAHRRAKALGYGMRSPPARAMADYFFKDCNCGQRTDARRVRRQGSVRSPSTLAATERGWYAIVGRSRARCPRSHDGRSAACGRDACAPRGAGRCCCGRDACAPRQWRDALRAGATPAPPGSGGMRCMQTRRPRSQGSSSCGAVAALRAGATLALPGVQGGATRSRASASPDACSDRPVPHRGAR
jgi:hypothetical protein